VFCFEIYFEINALRHNREYAWSLQLQSI
jgi:hypothetical protein